MYFDDCDIPQELSKKMSEFLKIVTGRTITFGSGKPTSGSVSLIDRYTDETLRQAYAEARNVAKRFCKLDNNLPPLPDVEVLPLKGLASIVSWCRSITQYTKPVKPAKTGEKEIFEAKPGVAGFTVNIKEIAKRIWMRVCSRRKD